MTWGDFVAASMAELAEYGAEAKGSVALTRASDWRMRYLDAHPGQSIDVYMVGLDERHLFVGETPGRIGFTRKLAKFYRYDLAQFESLGRD